MGVRLAAEMLLRESQKQVPVEYGDLIASGFATSVGEGFQRQMRVGYTAPYAAYVHELIGMKLRGQPRPSGIGVYWGPSGNAKFLERPFRQLKPQMRTIIRKEIRTAFSQGE